MSDLTLILGVGVITTFFTLGILVYIRRLKNKMRRSVLRYEKIKDKLEG